MEKAGYWSRDDQRQRQRGKFHIMYFLPFLTQTFVLQYHLGQASNLFFLFIYS